MSLRVRMFSSSQPADVTAAGAKRADVITESKKIDQDVNRLFRRCKYVSVPSDEYHVNLRGSREVFIGAAGAFRQWRETPDRRGRPPARWGRCGGRWCRARHDPGRRRGRRPGFYGVK